MKKILLICMFELSTAYLFGQATITLNTARTTGGTETACTLIELKPGFSFTAASSSSLTLTVDPSTCDPFGGSASSVSSNQNYIQTKTYTTADASRYMETVQYFDGLGRPMQTVQRAITPATWDLVSFQEYDRFGRDSTSWLPALASGNNGAFVVINTFKTKATQTYNNTTYNVVADTKPYNLLIYEASPLNRIFDQYGPGADWQNNGKAVKTDYQTNSSAFVVPLYTTTDTRTTVSITRSAGNSGNYSSGELYVTEITDEDGNKYYEAKDKLGRLVYTKQMDGNTPIETCYIYDSYGNLRAVLPPLAVFSSGTWTETTLDFKDYAYAYKYDNRNRCISKKIPGAEWVHYIYDNADRLIFTQDGENRKKSEWQFSIPDALGRVVLTGTCKHSLNYLADKPLNSIVKADRNNATNTYKGYAAPVGVSINTVTVLSVNYYDDYAFLGFNDILNNSNTQYNNEGYGACYGDHQAQMHTRVKACLPVQ